MEPFIEQTIVSQLTTHLREQIGKGELKGTMPGIGQLVRELGGGTDTVIAAIANLEREGIIVNQGAGRRRKIVKTPPKRTTGLRVQIMLYEKSSASHPLMVRLHHELRSAGHSPFFSSKSLLDLGMDVEKVKRFVRKTPADAWMILAGSKPILDWFAAQPTPAFALFGRQAATDIGGISPMKLPVLTDALCLMVELGHRRIVMMVREEGRKPKPGSMEQTYLTELESLGIPTGPYNLPDWDNQPGSFQRCLTSLFQKSPPTVLILDEPEMFFAAQQFLQQQGLRVPEDVSMIALDGHPAFDWFEPEVSHIRTDSGKWVPQAMRWVENVSSGTNIRSKKYVKSELIRGGTIGPAPEVK